MLIELTKLNLLPVASFEEGVAIGKVIKIIIDQEEGKIFGFLIKLPKWFAPAKVASLEDVVSIDQAAVVVRSSESLVEVEEIIRINEMLKRKFNLIGLRAVDKKGKLLGRVQDALIESDSGLIMRLYVKQYLSSKIYERSQIDKMTDRQVVLNTERNEKVKKTAPDLAGAKLA